MELLRTTTLPGNLNRSPCPPDGFRRSRFAGAVGASPPRLLQRAPEDSGRGTAPATGRRGGRRGRLPGSPYPGGSLLAAPPTPAASARQFARSRQPPAAARRLGSSHLALCDAVFGTDTMMQPIGLEVAAAVSASGDIPARSQMWPPWLLSTLKDTLRMC